MKRLPLFLTACLLGDSLAAQSPLPASSPAPAATAATELLRSAEELEQLLAPIALYPDALIALILPAATVPADIVLAARQLRDSPGDRSQIEHRGWDESVKSLTHYLEVLQWLDENLPWTKQVGEAFAQQPADVMQAIQRLRARAQAAGTLVNTPQQQVIAETEVIRIVPAQPDIIYVPRYTPEVVFVETPVYTAYPRPFLTFGLGVAVGSWLAYDCDWRRNTIWIGNRHRPWVAHDWRRPLVPIAPLHPPRHYRPAPDVRPWSPPPHSRATVVSSPRFRPAVARPTPPGVSAPPLAAGRPGSGPYVDRARRAPGNDLPVVPPLAPGFAATPRGERMGPPVPGRTAAPSNSLPRVTQPSVTAPDLQPLPTARRPERSGSSPRPPSFAAPVPASGAETPRSRSFPGPRHATPAAAPRPSIAPLPMAPTERPSPLTGPVAPRSYSRPQPPAVSAPAPAASAPAQSTPPAGDSRGQRGHWQRQR